MKCPQIFNDIVLNFTTKRRMWSSKSPFIGILIYLPSQQTQAVRSGCGEAARKRDKRDDSTNNTTEWRLRVRAGLLIQFNDQRVAKIRAADRYFTENVPDGIAHTKFFKNVPTLDGLRRGVATLDKLYQLPGQ